MIPAVSGLPLELSWAGLGKLTLHFAIGVCILGGLLCLLFGRGSAVVKSVFSCIHIALIYLCAMMLTTFFPEIRNAIPPLPFVSVSLESLLLWDITLLSSQMLFSNMLQLFLLAFLVNLFEDLLPRGKQILSWYFFRLLTACSALVSYGIIILFVNRFAPQIFDQWAAPILIALWLLIGLLGLSKGLLTLIAAVVNPVLGLLFAFFFSNSIGKQFTKSILTCLLMMAVLFGLYQLGFTGFTFSQLSFASFAPPFAIALASLFLFGKFL